jgi:hypothetical protein
MIPYKYGYLLGVLAVVIPALFIISLRKDLRHKILFLGLYGLIIGPILELWFIQDYWRPLTATNTLVGIEDFIHSFAALAIFGVAYEELFRKHYAKRHIHKHHWVLLLMPILLLSFYLFDQIFPQYYINSMYATIYSSVITAIIILSTRKDLFFDALISGVIAGIIFILIELIFLYFFPEFYVKFWLINNLSGITIKTIPIEELIWAFTCGLVVGPMYEFYAGLKFQREFKKIKKKK